MQKNQSFLMDLKVKHGLYNSKLILSVIIIYNNQREYAPINFYKPGIL